MSNPNLKMNKGLTFMSKVNQNVKSLLDPKERALFEIQEEVFREFLKHLSNLDGSVDLEKLRKVIYDEEIIRSISDLDWEYYRTKIFHTNLAFLEKAISKVKFGSK